jgi:DNA polymerase III subunit epsilon
MRRIVLDTETTGIDPKTGDRVIEIACIELAGLTETGKFFHTFINPDRDVPDDAVRVHGITTAFLRDKRRFDEPEVVDDFLAFLGDCQEIIAHNAPFDRGFINMELARCNRAPIADARWVDTLPMARARFPGQANSLDALCRRFNIDLSVRDKHSAIVDTRLLAQVYLELQGGRVQKLDFGGGRSDGEAGTGANTTVVYKPIRQRPKPLESRITDEERLAHEAFLAKLGDKAVASWGKRKG